MALKKPEPGYETKTERLRAEFADSDSIFRDILTIGREPLEPEEEEASEEPVSMFSVPSNEDIRTLADINKPEDEVKPIVSNIFGMLPGRAKMFEHLPTVGEAGRADERFPRAEMFAHLPTISDVGKQPIQIPGDVYDMLASGNIGGHTQIPVKDINRIESVLRSQGYTNMANVLNSVTTSISLVELSEMLTGDPIYGTMAATISPALGTFAGQAIYSLGVSPATQAALYSLMPSSWVTPAYSYMAGGAAAGGAAAGGAGAATGAAATGAAATGTGIGGGAAAGAGASLGGTLTFVGALAAYAYTWWKAEQAQSQRETQRMDIRDDKDDFIDNLWRTELDKIPTGEAWWITRNPVFEAEHVQIKGDDPRLVTQLETFYTDMEKRLEYLKDPMAAMRFVSRSSTFMSETDAEKYLTHISNAMEDRLTALRWQKEGVLAHAGNVATHETFSGQTKSLKEWAETLAYIWRDNADPSDYVWFKDSAMDARDVETGETIPTFVQTYVRDLEAERLRAAGAQYTLGLGRVEGRDIVPWTRHTSVGELKPSPSWQPLNSWFFYIGLPGTGQPGEFQGQGGWRSPNADEFKQYFGIE